MPRKKSITLELSNKLYKEVTGVAKYIGISKEEYLLMLVLRTQPIPVQVPVSAPEQFHPDTSMIETGDRTQDEADNYISSLSTKKPNIKCKKREFSYLG